MKKTIWLFISALLFVFSFFPFDLIKDFVTNRVIEIFLLFLLFIQKIFQNRKYDRYNNSALDNQRIMMNTLGVGDQWKGNGSIKPLSKEQTKRLKKRFLLLHKAMSRENQSRSVKKMKEYLKKLGRTKFQAFLVATIVNIVTLILVLTGTVDIEGVIGGYMPLINLTSQTIVTWLYVWVEGSIDKENVKKGDQTNEPDYSKASDASDKLTV